MLSQGSVHEKKKKKKEIQPGSDQGIQFLVERRPLLICSSVVNCLSMSGWVSTITRWFGASREDLARAKEEPPPCYFLVTSGSLGAWISGHVPQSKHPPSPWAAQPQPRTWWTDGSATAPGAVSTALHCPSELSFWWDSKGNHLHLAAPSSSDPACFQCSGSSGDCHWAIPLVEVGTCELPAVLRQRAVQIPWQRSNPPPHLLLGHLPWLISRRKNRIPRE